MNLNTIEKDYDKLKKLILPAFYASLKEHKHNCKYNATIITAELIVLTVQV